MEKYLGIIKICREMMGGCSIRIETRFSDDLDYLAKWHELYPNSALLILTNSEELQDFFEDFEDYSPVTEEEEEEAEAVWQDFRKLMGEM